MAQKGKSKRFQRARFLAGVALVISAVVWLFAANGWEPMLGMKTWWLNFLAREGPKAPLREDIVLVGVDLDSMTLEPLWPEDIAASAYLQKIRATQPGGWPWPRDVHAEIIRRMFDAGAKAVVVDFVFANNGPGDGALAAVCEEFAGRVFLAATIEERSIRDVGFAPKITGPPATILLGEERFLNGIGVVNFFPDWPEKIIRGYILGVRTQPQENAPVYPTFTGRAVELEQGKLPQPLPRHSTAMRYAGPGGTFNPIPAYEILDDALYQSNITDNGALKGKIVIYGPTASTFQDYHPTPFGPMLGAELHAQAINAALGSQHLFEAPQWLVHMAALAGGVVVLLFCRFLLQPLWRLVWIFVFGAATVALCFVAYAYVNLVIDATGFLTALGLAGIATFVVEIVAERVERARTRGTLERYVSRDVAGYLLDHPDSYQEALGGTRKPVTCLFSDVRDFTTISEQIEAADLVAQLNEYLGAMVEIVQTSSGTLDKFMGDAVMAVWGNLRTLGPGPDAMQAVQGALGMRKTLKKLNADWKSRGILELRIGIGVNSGEVIVGNIGSTAKMELTVIGDAVNLSSRLEGLTKTYSTDILIGEETAFLLDETVVIQPVDVVRVKGKMQPVEIHAVIGMRNELSEALILRLERHREALRLYKAMEFAEAKERFAVLTDEPDLTCFLAKLYSDRCAKYIAEPPADDWDGVSIYTTK